MQRIQSVDVLRGITIAAMMLVNNPGTWSALYAPLGHAAWHGYTPTDLVFPFFLFIVGCSIAFAYRGRQPDGRAYRKIAVRSLKLIGLGLFLGAFTLSFPFFKDPATVRLPGVLQRIGVVFFFAALLALHVKSRRVMLGITVSLLVGYWLWLGFVPLPDGSAPTFDRAPNNWAMYLDKLLLGDHTWQPDYDPEGLASTLPSIATALIGVLTGRMLVSDRPNKLTRLLTGGVLFLLGGHLWNLVFPINKALWTSSFVLVTAGWALLCLGVIYYLTDVKRYESSVANVFKMVGANALILYFLSSFIAKIFSRTGVHAWLFEHLYAHDFLPLKFSSLLYGLTVSGFYVLLGVWLYRRNIFIRV